MNEISSNIEKGVEALLDELRPSLAMHGGNAHLVRVEQGVVHLKLEGACHGCPMSTITFGMALKDMLQEKFPNDVQDVKWGDAPDEAADCGCAEEDKKEGDACCSE